MDSTALNNISLSSVMKFIHGDVSDVTEISRINSLLSNFRGNLTGFMGTVVYKQMNRLAKLLDAMDVIETRLYDKDRLQTTDEASLFQLMYATQSQIQTTIDFLMKIMVSVNAAGSAGALGKDVALNQVQVPSSLGQSGQLLNKEQRERVRQLFLQLESSTQNDLNK